MLFVGCAVSAAYDEVEPIPEEKPEEPGDQETIVADAYESDFCGIPSKDKYKIC